MNKTPQIHTKVTKGVMDCRENPCCPIEIPSYFRMGSLKYIYLTFCDQSKALYISQGNPNPVWLEKIMLSHPEPKPPPSCHTFQRLLLRP